MKLTNTHLSIYLICRQTFVVNDPQSSLSQVLAHCSPSLYHPTPDLSREMQKGWRMKTLHHLKVVDWVNFSS